MAFVEIVFPRLKKDATSIEEAISKVVPKLVVGLKQGGALAGLRGFLDLDDGRDVTGEFREILLLGRIISRPLLFHRANYFQNGPLCRTSKISSKVPASVNLSVKSSPT